MNNGSIESKNSSARRTYHRRNRKNNQTRLVPPGYIPFTTTVLSTTITTTTNRSVLINASSVPVKDLLAPMSYLIQYKHFFLIGLILLALLCIVSVLFLVFISKCTKRKSWRNRRQRRQDIKRIKEIPDFLSYKSDQKGENVVLIPQTNQADSLTNTVNSPNGLLIGDNISNTLSLDPLLVRKIDENNPPNAMALSPTADGTSLDTLHGSLISSPSQQIPALQSLPTPTRTTTKDSLTNSDGQKSEAEKDDDLHDLDLKGVQRLFTKAATNSASNIAANRTLNSVADKSIRRQERKAEDEERARTHGSNTNLYEKSIKALEEQGKINRKPHTNSQISLVSRTSEDSCY
ncbi:unnamed protein product [Adineta ricciae]|uniref:Uncharacterized protein n=1 Tax=Adineta ricciae TaxID=249248 RepID=A0A814PWQ6_ADIRI|nr:unnamed protein product [Adineta ricciae]CAF1111969.1 unnamed protein product [Adineta ricciae]